MTARPILLLAAAFLSATTPTFAAPPVPEWLIARNATAAPALTLQDMEGKTVDLAGLRGRWVLVHFWASWCGPCRKEMPTLQKLSRILPASQLTVLLVNTAESEETIFAFLPLVAPDLDSLLDRDGVVTDLWQPRGLPSSFLIDPEGRQRYLALGGQDWTAPATLRFLRVLTQSRDGSSREHRD